MLLFMGPKESASAVRWLGQWLPTVAFVVYEEQVSKHPADECLPRV